MVAGRRAGFALVVFIIAVVGGSALTLQARARRSERRASGMAAAPWEISGYVRGSSSESTASSSPNSFIKARSLALLIFMRSGLTFSVLVETSST